MTDRINIHDPIFELCHRLGLEPTSVKEITFRPNDVTATIYKTDENGSKYLEADQQTVASETRAFKVTSDAPAA